MIPRRDLLGSGLVGGVLGAFAGPEAQRAGDAMDTTQIVRALNELRTEVRNQRQFVEIAAVREAQVTFLRSNGKLPDFIDVGADIWFAVHDWHVRWQQPLNITRDANGRLTILLLSTLLILRTEVQGSYMSLPYDTRA